MPKMMNLCFIFSHGIGQICCASLKLYIKEVGTKIITLCKSFLDQQPYYRAFLSLFIL